MRSRRFPAVAALLLSTVLPAAPAAARSLSEVSFMAGCWKGKMSKGSGTIEERYTAPAGGLILGSSHVVGDEKTQFFELITIEQKGDDVLMTPMPMGKPSVPFKLVRSEGRKAVFENLEHDFPKRIIYALQEDGSLLARIEGDKPEKAEEFLMKPISCGGQRGADHSPEKNPAQDGIIPS